MLDLSKVFSDADKIMQVLLVCLSGGLHLSADICRTFFAYHGYRIGYIVLRKDDLHQVGLWIPLLKDWFDLAPFYRQLLSAIWKVNKQTCVHLIISILLSNDSDAIRFFNPLSFIIMSVL